MICKPLAGDLNSHDSRHPCSNINWYHSLVNRSTDSDHWWEAFLRKKIYSGRPIRLWYHFHTSSMILHFIGVNLYSEYFTWSATKAHQIGHRPIKRTGQQCQSASQPTKPKSKSREFNRIRSSNFEVLRSISSFWSAVLKVVAEHTLHRLANHTLNVRHSDHTTSNRQAFKREKRKW